jgi:hypothetical protein
MEQVPYCGPTDIRRHRMTGRPGICALLCNPRVNPRFFRPEDRPVPQMRATGLQFTFPLFLAFYFSIYNSYIAHFRGGIAQSV